MIVIYGASDDLIEVEGDIREEFYAIDKGIHILTFSDGTALGVTYDSHGIWRIRRLAPGTATYRLTESVGTDNDYSDKAELHGSISWVAHGVSLKMADL